MATRKKNPQDSTLRNVRAAAKRIAALERELHTIKQRFTNIEEGFYEFFSGVEAAQKAAGRKRR